MDPTHTHDGRIAMNPAFTFAATIRTMRPLRAPALSAILCILWAAALPAHALTPPAPGQVTDEDAVRLLKSAYEDEAVGLAGEWSAMQALPDDDDSERVAASRTICADSGREAYGPRMIAVCTSFNEAGHVTPGLVDLWLLLDPRSGRPARVGASKRGIATGGFGTPGEVGFFAVGPARTAFALDSGYSNMGWSSSIRTLYFAENDRFDELLSVGTLLDNGGACDPSEDKACRERSISIECTLRANTAKVDGGYYALRIEAKGQRGGKPLKASIPIPRKSGAYAPPQARLVKEGCDQGY
jgi:hypothetical protein